MTCSDEVLMARRLQAEGLGAHAGGVYASYRIGCGFVNLTTLTVHRGECIYGPFTTVEEAANMIILLGGGSQ